MPNPFVHVELNTTDLKKAKDFYGKLFSWKLEDMPMGDMGTYTMVNPGEGTGGGMMKNPVQSGSRRTIHVARLCRGGRRRRCHQESEVAGRDDHERRNRSAGSRMVQHHRGPDRRTPGPLETQEEVSVEAAAVSRP